MRYVNSKTGAVVDSLFNISGGDWTNADDVKETEETKAEENSVATVSDKADEKQVTEELVEDAPIEEQEDTESFEGITIKEIKQELDAFGVEYDPRAKKKDLYDLMMQRK